jgi:hypothetical protein
MGSFPGVWRYSAVGDCCLPRQQRRNARARYVRNHAYDPALDAGTADGDGSTGDADFGRFVVNGIFDAGHQPERKRHQPERQRQLQHKRWWQRSG